LSIVGKLVEKVAGKNAVSEVAEGINRFSTGVIGNSVGYMGAYSEGYVKTGSPFWAGVLAQKEMLYDPLAGTTKQTYALARSSGWGKSGAVGLAALQGVETLLGGTALEQAWEGSHFLSGAGKSYKEPLNVRVSNGLGGATQVIGTATFVLGGMDAVVPPGRVLPSAGVPDLPLFAQNKPPPLPKGPPPLPKILQVLEGESKAAPMRAATVETYSVAYEMRLNPADLGRSRAVHFNRANAALDSALQSDPAFAAQMDRMIPGVGDSVSSVGGRATPGGWIWHHSTERGVLQLVPEVQHTPDSIFWNTMHPGGPGGYSIWSIPAGAPKK
jgi:hypothetical protein